MDAVMGVRIRDTLFFYFYLLIQKIGGLEKLYGYFNYITNFSRASFSGSLYTYKLKASNRYYILNKKV